MLEGEGKAFWDDIRVEVLDVSNLEAAGRLVPREFAVRRVFEIALKHVVSRFDASHEGGIDALRIFLKGELHLFGTASGSKSGSSQKKNAHPISALSGRV